MVGKKNRVFKNPFSEEAGNFQKTIYEHYQAIPSRLLFHRRVPAGFETRFWKEAPPGENGSAGPQDFHNPISMCDVPYFYSMEGEKIAQILLWKIRRDRKRAGPRRIRLLEKDVERPGWSRAAVQRGGREARRPHSTEAAQHGSLIIPSQNASSFFLKKI